MSRSLTVEILTDADALSRLEPEWWALWRRSPGATPFASPAWLLPWWSAFEPGRLLSAVVRVEGRLVALAPLYLEDGAFGRRLLPVGLGISDHLDILLDPVTAEAAGPLLGSVLVDVGGWDIWELEELAPDAAAWNLPVSPCLIETLADQSACPVLAPLDPALGAVPARQRRKLRMARHRAARRGGRIEAVSRDGIIEFLEIAADLHGARWAERGEDGILRDERVLRFHRAAMPRLAAAGLVRATILTIEGRVAGAYYGLRHGPAAYAYLGGFDPAFSFESPGTVLLADAMEDAARDGAGSFHFLRGQEAYKYAWGAADRVNRRRSFRRA